LSVKVEDVFERCISINTLHLSETESVDVDVFKEIFKDVEDKRSYHEYISIDGGVLGYKRFFDRCKQKGILN